MIASGPVRRGKAPGIASVALLLAAALCVSSAGAGHRRHSRGRILVIAATRAHDVPHSDIVADHVFVIDPKTRARTRVPQTSFPASLIPGTRRLVFVGGRSHLITADRHGNHRRSVLKLPEGHGILGVSVSADGRHIAYEDYFGNHGARIGTLTTGGRHPRVVRKRVLGGDGFVRPQYSPDNRQIVFVQNDRIKIMRADGSKVSTLVKRPPHRWDSEPSYSPDGRRIVFTRNRTHSHGFYSNDSRKAFLFVARADGTHAHRIARGNSATFSPSGKRVAYIKVPTRPNEFTENLFVKLIGGGTARQLTDLEFGAREPDWKR